MEKILFKDLSWPLRIAAIAGFIDFIYLIFILIVFVIASIWYI